MIKTRADLKYYLQEDRMRNVHSYSYLKYIVGLLYRQENYMAYRYLKTLRKYEYYLNTNGIFSSLFRLYYRIKWRRLSFDYKVVIQPNMIGCGLKISHLGMGGVIVNAISVGNYCSVNAGVIVGNKDTPENRATIGNHVSMNVGCKIIGKVIIGDNAIIAPNSVVVKDVPVNAIVSGIPAKILKYREI